MFNEGKERFSELADFNFIAGYSVSIFPYEYGGCETLEEESKQMLSKAVELNPKNPLYKMIYLGNMSAGQEKEYRQARMEMQKVLDRFDGAGMLNKYFREVLKDKKDNK